MLRFVVRRLLLLIPILIGLSILVFIWVRALPGSPAEALLGERATPAAVEQLNKQYGLDKPVYEQYLNYLNQTVHFVFGIPLGFFAAKYYGGIFDQSSLFLSLLGISIPIFFLGLLLKYIFAVRLGWLPTVGRIDVQRDVEHPTNFYVLDAIITRDWETLKDVLSHLILPAIALGTIPLAILSRITRASVLDVQNEDYVRTARAKGLSPIVVDRRHVLRNAMLPISTVIGLQTGLLLSGAVLTETVFAWPGVGRWLAEAIFNRDYPVLQGGILFLAIIFVLVNLVVDISYAIINPRIRYS